MASGPQEIDWNRLDKRKFFVVGVGLFSGVTTALFPLTVVKTRQMAAHRDVPAGLSGTKQVAQQIWRAEGIRGFYRGFGTVVFGTIPARTVYLSSLEMTKAAVSRVGERFDVSPAALAGASSFVGGAAASASTQAVVVPIDVISQRLMMHGVDTGSSSAGAAAAGAQQPVRGAAAAAAAGGSSRPAAVQQPGAAAPAAAAAPPQPGQRGFHTSSSRAGGGSVAQRRRHATSWGAALHHQHHQQQQQQRHAPSSSSGPLLRRRQLSTAAPGVRPMNGFQMARLIVAQEGVGGLYRGFVPSLLTFVPNSAMWWGAYGFWTAALWEQLPRNWVQPGSSSDGSSAAAGPSTRVVVGVQTTAAVLSGCTASILTNPLDLIKTRLQVAEVGAAGAVPSWRSVLRELLAEEGARGLLRGAAPRMASSAMWGTAMVSVYEFLKRTCAVPPQQ